jgi:DNA repair protein RadC
LTKSRSSSSYTIKDWPLAERPREKLLHRGAHFLTDVELLAILIRTGTGKESALDLARSALKDGTTLRALGSKTPGELTRLKGIGPAKAVELLAAFEIGRRMQADAGPERPVIRTPGDVAQLLIPRLRDRPIEVFLVLVLDARNAVKLDKEISQGTLNASIVHPREVFKTAIDASGASIIVVHNHPSGNPEPSREDIDITRQLVEAGRIVGIPLHDHVIIAGNTYTSMAERGEV